MACRGSTQRYEMLCRGVQRRQSGVGSRLVRISPVSGILRTEVRSR